MSLDLIVVIVLDWGACMPT